MKLKPRQREEKQAQNEIERAKERIVSKDVIVYNEWTWNMDTSYLIPTDSKWFGGSAIACFTIFLIT